MRCLFGINTNFILYGGLVIMKEIDDREIATRACEDILRSSAEYNELNNQILEVENKIKADLSSAQLKEFLTYEALVQKQILISNFELFNKLGTY